MTTHRKRVGLLTAAVLVFGTACEPSLNVTNPNNPDFERALATPEDVQSLAVSTMNSWYLTSTWLTPYCMLMVTSDVATANFGNFGMRFNNLEPRIPYNNSSAVDDQFVARDPWENNYGTLGAANDALRAIAAGIELPGGEAATEKYQQLAMFTQAASLTNLALLFDRAFVVDEETDPATSPPQLQPYREVATAALAKWDALIAASAGKSHTYNATSEFPVVGAASPLNSTRMNRLANTMAALLLAYTPRTSAEVAQVDWAKVAAYAEKGIGTGTAGDPFDLVVQGDNNNWWSYIAYYGDEPTWMRVDHRVISRMRPEVPPKFDGTIQPAGTSADARYASDFQDHQAVIGDRSRGVWMQSQFTHRRYRGHARTSSTAARTAVPYLLAAESDLVRAEALIRRATPDLATAAELINKTRVGRGNLPPATAAEGAATLLGYIEYERDIELYATSGMDLFRRRRIPSTDAHALQPGTVRHLPIPARELETLGMPVYTFGGVGQPDMYVAPAGGEFLQLQLRSKPSFIRHDGFRR